MREQIIEKILQNKIIAIVRGLETRHLLPLVQALHTGGISLVEVTFNQKTPDSWKDTCNGIRRIAEEFDGRVAVGAGTVLIPWALITLILGNFKLAISLAVLYAVILVVRNLVEPHVVAHQIGLHPLVTLMGICVGFRMFGFMGMFIVPLILLCIVKLNEWGYIRLWEVETPPLPKNEILSIEPAERK